METCPSTGTPGEELNRHLSQRGLWPEKEPELRPVDSLLHVQGVRAGGRYAGKLGDVFHTSSRDTSRFRTTPEKRPGQ